ncbi:hypothetical protein ERO13_A13G160450v2 [Gossypium hirsutum]|nr:hypothetical protein ERO13_A13G160450v2 [Gossypium hirsutum]
MSNTLIISSGEIISNNPDLVTQLLLRLRTKTLLKLKCVSKQWLSLICDPHFCISHTRYHQTNGFLSPTALFLKWIYALPSEFDVIPLKHNRAQSQSPFLLLLQLCSQHQCASVLLWVVSL